MGYEKCLDFIANAPIRLFKFPYILMHSLNFLTKSKQFLNKIINKISSAVSAEKIQGWPIFNLLMISDFCPYNQRVFSLNNTMEEGK